jgi:hypothetical protein
VNKRQTKIISRTLSGRIIYCPTGGPRKLKLQVRYCLGQVEHCSVGPDIVRWEVSGNVIFSQKSSLSSQV